MIQVEKPQPFVFDERMFRLRPSRRPGLMPLIRTRLKILAARIFIGILNEP